MGFHSNPQKEVIIFTTIRPRIKLPVHGSKEMPKGTFMAILRQAGIDKNSI